MDWQKLRILKMRLTKKKKKMTKILRPLVMKN